MVLDPPRLVAMGITRRGGSRTCSIVAAVALTLGLGGCSDGAVAEDGGTDDSGDVEGDTGIAKVSIVGLGMKDHAGVATRMFEVLAGEGINIQLISTSEIKVSVVIDEKYTELAVRALHAAFVEAGAAPPCPEA